MTVDQSRHHGHAVAEIVDEPVSGGRRPADVDTGDQASLHQHHAWAQRPLAVEQASGSNCQHL